MVSTAASRQRQLHREALLARLEVDSNLLLSMCSAQCAARRRFLFCYENGSVRLSAIGVHCGKTAQDTPAACIEVEYEWGAKISIGAISTPVAHPNRSNAVGGRIGAWGHRHLGNFETLLDIGIPAERWQIEQDLFIEMYLLQSQANIHRHLLHL